MRRIETINRKLISALIIACLVLTIVSSTDSIPVKAAPAILVGSPGNVSFRSSSGPVSVDFNATCTIENTTVPLGGSTSVTGTLKGTGTGNITLTLNGTLPIINQPFNFGEYTEPFEVLSSQSFTVENISVLGLEAKLVLRVSSSILGSIVASGNGTISPTTLSWSSWGTQTTTVSTTSSALVGNVIQLTTSLNYTISAALVANVTAPIAGTYAISSISFPAITGSPSITSQVTVGPAAPNILFGSTIIPGIPNILLIAVVVFVIIAAIALTRRKR
jgi:hypothetical protein